MAPHEREAMKEAMDMLLHRGDMCDWTGTHDRVVIDALRTALAEPKPPMTHEQWLDIGLQRGWINRHAFMSQAYTEEE